MTKTKELQGHLDALAHRIHVDQDGWRQSYAGLSASVGVWYDHYSKATGAMYSVGRAAAAKIRAAENNDLIPEHGRLRLLGEARAEAMAALDEQERLAHVATDTLRAILTGMALPRVERDREMPARDEVRLLVQGAGDPLQTMLDLAQRHDELAAVVTSSYGESLLRATGVQDARKLHHESVCGVALASNVDHPDQTVRGSAMALRDLASGLETVTTATRTYVTLENELDS
jgi:hypothetical protein